jgi:hypothetical protein
VKSECGSGNVVGGSGKFVLNIASRKNAFPHAVIRLDRDANDFIETININKIRRILYE